MPRKKETPAQPPVEEAPPVVDHASRTHALLSASSAARWLACPPSAVASELYPKTSTTYTEEGTLAHEVAEIAVRNATSAGKVLPFPKDATQEMINHAGDYRGFILEHWRNPTDLLLLEERVDFSNWVPNGFGTCDCIIISGSTLIVIDYKYGKGVEVSADQNPQMMLYALGALNDYGFAYEVDTIQMNIFQPRINNISTFEMTVDQLLDWADNHVKPIAAMASKGEGLYKPGDHCRFCPHAGKCRELANLCTAFVTEMDFRVPVLKLAPYEISNVLKIIPLIEHWTKAVKAQALTDLLNGEEIPGYKVVAGRGSRQWSDPDKVYQEMIAMGIPQASYMSEPELLSVAQIEKNLGKKWTAETLGENIKTIPGSPTIAPMDDKRPVYDRLSEAQKDFE